MLALAALAAPNLHVAAYKDDVKVIRDQLRLGVDVNLKSDEGDRALHVAVAKGSVNAVAALLEATNAVAPTNSENMKFRGVREVRRAHASGSAAPPHAPTLRLRAA